MNNFTNKDLFRISKRLMEIKRDRAQTQRLNGDGLEHLLQEMYLSIEEQLRAAAYYRALADIAPNQFAAGMIEEFAADEREHAYQLQRAYERLTGETFVSEYEYEFDLNPDDYVEYLEERVIEETNDYKKYKSFYLMTDNNYLRDIFFNAMHDEMYHALREMYLIHRAMTDMGMM
ncbi:hypothetical protein Halha_1015 [Halobacteroides halobius DSM 5150]|uniref:Rubrerythrin diiron-binding domain-containing protein n=1 Tax=Halobacteroides halobius (strain ATCC 35273 / DSM 5150 / MD-1) TaxID=748449 RepID=L0K7I5_HALHC|nr:ferritin-like domain-containing protein [Halobacteroides halobius]AGB40976.1 hypothetical protein Halha_1015 [Halobacteroides halobius DSM 5150]